MLEPHAVTDADRSAFGFSAFTELLAAFSQWTTRDTARLLARLHAAGPAAGDAGPASGVVTTSAEDDVAARRALPTSLPATDKHGVLVSVLARHVPLAAKAAAAKPVASDTATEGLLTRLVGTFNLHGPLPPLSQCQVSDWPVPACFVVVTHSNVVATVDCGCYRAAVCVGPPYWFRRYIRNSFVDVRVGCWLSCVFVRFADTPALPPTAEMP